MSEFTVEELEHRGKRELARMILKCERVRKHWRILGIKAALNRITTDQLLHVCFQEVLGIVPEDDELTKELEALVEELEQMRGETANKAMALLGKEPRKIDLG